MLGVSNLMMQGSKVAWALEGNLDLEFCELSGLTSACTKAIEKIATRETKKASQLPERLFLKTGNTYFRTFGTIIGSESLTTVFEMGTGMTFQIWSPERPRQPIRLPEPKVDWFGLLGICGIIVDEFRRSTSRYLICESAKYRWSSICPLVPVS
jgi:hypothetical protein